VGGLGHGVRSRELSRGCGAGAGRFAEFRQAHAARSGWDLRGRRIPTKKIAHSELRTIRTPPSNTLRTFIYDTNTLDENFSGQYTKGRLVAVQPPAASVQLVEMYAYTQAGKISGKRLQTKEGNYTVNLVISLF
jgi:hypothetical protein